MTPLDIWNFLSKIWDKIMNMDVQSVLEWAGIFLAALFIYVFIIMIYVFAKEYSSNRKLKKTAQKEFERANRFKQ